MGNTLLVLSVKQIVSFFPCHIFYKPVYFYFHQSNFGIEKHTYCPQSYKAQVKHQVLVSVHVLQYAATGTWYVFAKAGNSHYISREHYHQCKRGL